MTESLEWLDIVRGKSEINQAMNEAREADVELTQLRPEKQTRPRMWFAGPAVEVIEDRIPREGESYSPDAYSIFNWKGGGNQEEST